MPLLLWCVIAACVLPYVAHLAVMWSRWQRPEGYERRYPRVQAARLEGIGARAWAAEQNAWEALTVFAPVALIAWGVGTDEALNGLLGVGWVVFRLGHIVAYLVDRPFIRSSMFTLSLGCALGLVGLAASA